MNVGKRLGEAGAKAAWKAQEKKNDVQHMKKRGDHPTPESRQAVARVEKRKAKLDSRKKKAAHGKRYKYSDQELTQAGGH